MTVEMIQSRVGEIQKARRDPENAHQMEDTLWLDVLEAIADGDCEDPRQCAGAALATVDLDFPRWYGQENS